MEPFYQEPMAIIYNGNALKVLRALPNESIQMCMTSPPYWGLRNYADGASMVWGGDENCQHEWTEGSQGLQHENRNNLRGTQEEVHGKTGVAFIQRYDRTLSGFCLKCGAWLGQLGLEPTPELYVEHLMMIFREVKRVLRRDGSFYLNIGDTYFSNPSNQQGHGFGKSGAGTRAAFENLGRQKRIFTNGILKPKCMVCIPERVMFAMIEEGWILNNKIIWHKSNAMPGSQKGRFTTSWEYLYFFTKNSKTILWRNRQTGEWRDKRPTKEENYPWGGMYYYPEMGEYGWEKVDGCVKIMPLWMGFDHYFDLDAVRVPHTTQSLERYQRGVNLGRPAEGKSGEVGPMQQYKRAPQWFQEMFGEDHDYKGKFDDLFGHGPQPQSFNLRVRDVKRGKGGVSAQGGELKASEKEIEEYEYPEKHHGSSMTNQESLHREKRYESKYIGSDYGQLLQGFQRDHTIEKAREQSREDAQRLFPNNPEKQQEYINYIHDHQSHPNGKNPGDLWSISTQPSSISVCPKCESVFPRLMKICPHCKIEGIVGHFAPYPEALCVDPIKANTKPGDTILDPLAGGGTTGVAAKRLGRKAILIDCVRAYCVMARYKLQRVECQPELELKT